MKNVTAIILAGGNSSRMGMDKGLIKVRGKAMVQHLIDLFKEMGIPGMIISNNDSYEQFGIPVFQDIIGDKGPLVGVLSGLTHSRSDQNIIVSCDTPFIYKQTIEKLIGLHEGYEVTVASINERLNPLIGVYNKSVIDTIKEQINNGEHKVELLLGKVNSNVVRFTDNPEQFINLNSPEDIKSLEDLVKVRFFGQLSELVGVSYAELPLPETDSDIELKEVLVSLYPELSDMDFKTAVDEELTDFVPAGTKPKEIAVFPPFAGG